MFLSGEPGSWSLTSTFLVPFGRRSSADSSCFDSETRRGILHSSRLQLTLQPAVRISISSPPFKVIFWRP